VRNPLTQMMPPQYPLLLFVPAIGLDLVLQRWTKARLAARGDAERGVRAMFVAVQWPFATFLNSEYARNPLFGQHLWPYMIPATSALRSGPLHQGRERRVD
jgi:hypothetical protein